MQLNFIKLKAKRKKNWKQWEGNDNYNRKIVIFLPSKATDATESGTNIFQVLEELSILNPI